MRLLVAFAALATTANAYFLFGMKNIITTERIDPIVNPGKQSGHCHSVVGGSNFRLTTSTSLLRQSSCTSSPILQDKSAYWFPNLYFQWQNGSFTSLDGGVVIYYLYSDKSGTTKAFPDDFRMISGDPYLRTYDAKSFAQKAITYLCLDFSGTSVRYNELPPVACPSGIRAEINFPSCWDGKNVDSADHKSHVAFLSGGPDSGSCTDPKFPVTLPRIFMEVYWASHDFDALRGKAKNSKQPFVFANGDPTGYGYHADFLNGWDAGVLQRVVDNCHCNPFGDAACCASQGLFTLQKDGNCRITKTWDEQTTGTLAKLPGNNPVQPLGTRATVYNNDVVPPRIDPIYAYTGNTPAATGHVVALGSKREVDGSPAPNKQAPSPAPKKMKRYHHHHNRRMLNAMHGDLTVA